VNLKKKKKGGKWRPAILKGGEDQREPFYLLCLKIGKNFMHPKVARWPFGRGEKKKRKSITQVGAKGKKKKAHPPVDQKRGSPGAGHNDWGRERGRFFGAAS